MVKDRLFRFWVHPLANTPGRSFVASDRMTGIDAKWSLPITAVDVPVWKAVGRDERELDLSCSGLDRVGSLGLI
jgi:hypothetical protein